jgi:uncharacterized spore protein YtfJ
MAGVDEVKAEVGARLEAGEFVERLADRIGARVQASAVFGQPVERGDITVIPVARATWGFGGGSGGEAGKEGAGGGGGGFVSPLGYIEVRDSGAEFKPIRDPRLLAATVAAAMVAASLVARAVARS